MTPRFLRANLCFLYGTTMASEGLLEAAIAQCKPGDLRDYFAEHLVEETGHLQFVKDDLARLGVTDILRFPEAAQWAGSQYYYIAHEHPAMLLGYMAALERPMPLAMVSQLESLHGPLTSIRHHAVHDVGHATELRQQIARLADPLRARVQENEAWIANDWTSRVIPRIELAANHFRTNL
jgi:heme oxygenase-like protein